MKYLLTSFIFIFIFCKAFAQIEFHPLLTSENPEIKELFKQKNYKKALQIVSELIESEPANGENYYTRAILNYYKSNVFGWIDTAIVNDCKRALEKKYSDPEVYYLIFSQYCQCDRVVDTGIPIIDGIELDYNIMRQPINEAISQDPKNEKYLIARAEFFKKYLIGFGNELDKDMYTYKNDLESIIYYSINKKNKAKAYIQLSEIELYKNEDTARGLSYLTDAIDIDPSNVVLYSIRADIKSELKNYQGAIEDYNFYLNKKRTANELKQRGRCYLQLNRFSLALSDFNSAILIYEAQRSLLLKQKQTQNKLDYQKINLSEVYNLRGLTYIAQNDMTKGCLDFNKAFNYGSKSVIGSINKFCR